MENREPEVWKAIPDYEGLYEVSSWGRVKSLERYVVGSRYNPNQKVLSRFLKFNVNFGYNITTLKKIGKGKKFRVCRLVGLLFLSDYNVNMVINHKDEDKLNDYFRNLECVTIRENTTYSTRNKTSKYKGVSYDDACNNKKWKASIYINGKQKNLGRFYKEKQAHQAYLNALKEYGLKNKYAKQTN